MSKSDDGDRSVSFSFSLGPGDALRQVHDDGVAAFDEALHSIGTGGVNHFIDPQRLKAFRSGGPSVWSVATAPVEGGTLYLTYGFSAAIDPAAACDFEMSVLVPGEPTMWPALLLRALCRYMLGSGRTLEAGQSMPFPDAITRFFAPPHERDSYPYTAMNAAVFAVDPLLPSIYTPRGVVQVRRVVGVFADELQLMDLWSPAGFVQAIAARDPRLATDLERPSATTDPRMVELIEQGSRTYGSEVPYVAVPGVGWSHDDDDGLQITFPGGPHALRIHRMVRARLAFGRHLLVHDLDPEQTAAVVFEPADELTFRNDGDTLVVGIPADHPLFDTFAQVGDGPSVSWTFG
jgi:hypothetical protein